MKTRIEISCVECDLRTSLCEVEIMVKALALSSIELKVFKDKNRSPDKGVSYITFTATSNVNELCQIHELKGKIAVLCDELESLKK